MTFTLVSHLRELLLALVKSRLERQAKEEAEKERKEIEVWLWSFISAIDLLIINHCYYIRNLTLHRKKKRGRKGHL